MSVSLELVKDQLDKLINETYEEGWNDCKENMTLQLLNEEKYDQLQNKFRIQKSRLNLAIKLLRYAQRTPCGSDGQFDRFFEDEVIDDYI